MERKCFLLIEIFIILLNLFFQNVLCIIIYMNIKKILLFNSLLTLNNKTNAADLDKKTDHITIRLKGNSNLNFDLGVKKDIYILDTIKSFVIYNKYIEGNLLNEISQKEIQKHIETMTSEQKNKEYDLFNGFKENPNTKFGYHNFCEIIGAVLENNKEYEVEINNFTTSLTSIENPIFKNTKFKFADKELILESIDDNIKIIITNTGISVQNKNKRQTSILSFSESEEKAKEVQAIQANANAEALNIQLPEDTKKTLVKYMGEEYGTAITEQSKKALGFFNKHQKTFAIIGGVATLTTGTIIIFSAVTGTLKTISKILFSPFKKKSKNTKIITKKLEITSVAAA